MKKNLFLFLIFLSTNLFATNYYVSNSGNDNNSGTSTGTAWATLSKVQEEMTAETFISGDQILFNRGDEWRGSLTISISGLTIGAYGTGDKPVITGLKEITGWTNLGNNIWSSTDSDLPGDYDNLTGIFINGSWNRLGRYPDDSYRYYDSFSGKNVLIDNNASYTNNQWQGAQCAYRNNLYIIGKKTIAGNSATQITLSSDALYELNNQDNGDEKNNGYIIQNDIDCLNLTGEWCYRNGIIYVYFEGDLNNQTVEMACVNRGIYLTGNTTVKDIELKGYYYTIFEVGSASNLLIDNVTASHSNYFFKKDGTGSLNLSNSTITNIFSDAIYTEGISSTVYNNTFQDIGNVFGLGTDGFAYRCIAMSAAPVTIRRNIFKNIGYNVINWGNNVAIVDSNYIDNFGTILADGGAIYVYKTTNQGSVVRKNIVVNGHTSFDGIAYHPSVGLYQDANCSGVTWEYNTCVNVDYAFKVNRSYGTSIMRYNKAFDIGKIHTVYPDSYGVSLSYSTRTEIPIEPQFQGLTFTHNVMVGNELCQNMMWNFTSDFNSNNIVDYNTYATPFQYRWDNGEKLFKYKGSTYWSLSEWQNGGAPISSWDDNSTASPIYYTSGTLSDKAVIVVNPTTSDSTYILSPIWTWMNINGDTTVSGTQTISPFDAEIFFKTGECDSCSNAPHISTIPDQTIQLGQVFSEIQLDNYVDDLDTPDSLIVWSFTGNSRLTIDTTDRVATITYPEGWTGSESITFTASDGSSSDSDVVTFTVNDTVVSLSYKIDETNENNYSGVYPNEPTSITGWTTGDWCAWYGVDLNNVDSIVWSYGVPYDSRTWEMRLDSYDGQVIYQGTNTNTGSWTSYDSLRADVDFDYGVRDVYLFATSVNTWNFDYLRFVYEQETILPPSVTDIPDQFIYKEDSFLNINLDDFVSDADTPDSLITWNHRGDSILTVDIIDRVANISYPGGWTGSESITFTASDGSSSDSVIAKFQVMDTLYAINVYYPPSCWNTFDGKFGFYNVSGGSGTYLYSIDNGNSYQASPEFTNVLPGFYDFVLKDYNTDDSLIVATNVEMIIQDSIHTDIIVVNETNTDANGSITLDMHPLYIYNWSDGASGYMRTGLSTGYYEVSVIDTRILCTKNYTIFVDRVISPDTLLTSTVLDVSNVDSVVGAQIEPNEYIHTWHPGYYAYWADVDLSNVDSIEYVYDTPYDNREWEIRIGSYDGTTIYSGTHNSSGGWYVKDTIKIDVDFDYGVQDLYLYATTYNTWTLHYFKLIYEGNILASPIISGIPDQVIEEGESFAPISLDGYVEDSDTPDSLISWSCPEDSDLTVNISNRVASVSYPSGWTGSEEIIFTASDGTSSDSDTAMFTVTDTSILITYTIDENNVSGYYGVYIGQTSIGDWGNGYSADGKYAYWGNVDLNNVDSIVYSYATPYDNRTWEMRLDSAQGELIFSGSHNNTGSWTTFDSLRFDVDFNYGTRDVYLIITTWGVWDFDYLRFVYEAPINYSLKISDLYTSSKELTSKDDDLLSIYPVPAESELTIVLSNVDEDAVYKAQIYNIEGKVVREYELRGSSNNISVEEFNSGMYLIKVNLDRSVTKTFIIK